VPREGQSRSRRVAEVRVRRLQHRRANPRLEQAIDVLTRLVRVVAAQNERMKRNFGVLSGRVEQLNGRVTRGNGRVDQLTKAIMAGRTGDLRRLAQIERRLEALERRLG
jgi:hypothetical protein